MEFKTVIQAIKEKKMKVRQQWSDGFFGNLGRDERCPYFAMYQKMKDDAEAQERELDEAEKFLHALQQNKEHQPQLPQAHVSLSSPPSADVIEIFEWLLGYSDFPEKRQGDGAFWWRKELRHRLEFLGIHIGGDAS